MNKFLNIFSAVFWLGMLILTAAAKPIHNNRLPHTEVMTVKKQDFIFTFSDDNGNEITTPRRAVGIPGSLPTEDIYVIIQEEVYGENRYFAQKADVTIYENYYSEEYTAVMFGLSVGDRLIISSDKPLSGEYPIEVYYDEQ